jgi:hypothetical protein
MTMSEAELQSILTTARLPYETGRDGRGRPMARFSCSTTWAEALSFRAVLRGDIVEFRVDDILPAVADADLLWQFNEFNQDSYVSRIHLCTDGGTIELCGTVHVSALRRSEVLLAELGYLADSVAAVRQGEVYQPDIPESVHGRSMDDVLRAVQSAGFAMEARRDGRLLVGSFMQADGAPYFVELFKAAGRFLCVRAHPQHELRVREDLDSLLRLQPLNAALGIGALAIARGEGRVYYTLAHILDWLEIDGALIRYLVEGAGAALQLAAGIGTAE